MDSWWARGNSGNLAFLYVHMLVDGPVPMRIWIAQIIVGLKEKDTLIWELVGDRKEFRAGVRVEFDQNTRVLKEEIKYNAKMSQEATT